MNDVERRAMEQRIPVYNASGVGASGTGIVLSVQPDDPMDLPVVYNLVAWLIAVGQLDKELVESTVKAVIGA